MADEISGSKSGSLAFLAGGGEMGNRTRSFDWSATPLGPMGTWPQSLRSALSICLNSNFPIAVYWGDDLVLLYNDQWSPIPGEKHPWALGRPAREVWPEIWHIIEPLFRRVMTTGEATRSRDQLLPMHRHGFTEECYFDYTFSPIRGETGQVEGIFNAVLETTTRVIGERRLRTLRELGAWKTGEVRSADEAARASARILAENPHDLPFSLIYLLDDDGREAALAGSTGLSAMREGPATVELDASTTTWPFQLAAETGKPVDVRDLTRILGNLSGGIWPESPQRAVVLPLAKSGQAQCAGFLVAGVSPRLALNDDYRGFLDLLAGHIAAAIANARAYEEERRRAEALAELDRAKTAFFSNVSHEFRTPLTLVLGPVEDILADSAAPLSPSQQERLEVAHRNGLRLQRLVNSLLDFSRIEAGRVRATYEPTDLAEFTADLAGNFRSLCETAGLQLAVDCPTQGEPVFVDRSMWEKIVLNLLSNAFKFTFDGEIAVSLRQVGRAAELRVRDTGTGIPAAELPRLFERFHRVENARGRTHEGSGIGLALVQELVKLHGGSITAESQVGRGTTFVVSVPLGSDHLPPEQVAKSGSESLPTTNAGPFVEEAFRWLPDAVRHLDPGSPSPSLTDDQLAPASSPRQVDADRPRVLVADDNADMRRYVVRLLSDQYAVESCADGAAALDSVRRQVPDLILSDVMMPRLDGFGLLRKLRSDPRTAGVPVILLSARAGEESRVEGIQAGADDYLVKPFSARELQVRVGSLLQISRLRREADESVRASEERYRNLFESMDEGYCVIEMIYAADGTPTDYRFLVVNPAFVEHTGLKDAVGKTMREMVPDHDRHWFETYGRVAATGEPVRFVSEAVAMGGLWFELYAFRVGEPRSRQVAVLFTNITARKRAEQERERLVLELREQDRRKDEFLATLAHELRNPLAPIRNGLQVLRLGGATGEMAENARNMMERQLGQMVHLIDDLLDLSRISRGKIELRKERIELAKAIRQAVETSSPLIESGGHNLTISVPPGPIYVDADLTRLAQVFSNLLNNAAKYTERGGHVRLAVERQGGEVIVSVRDDGLGIPAHMLPRVFDMFTQVDRHLERSQGGLGIGLSIVKRLVEMHGGSVGVESDGPGTGSEFTVRLPVVLSMARPEPVDDQRGRSSNRRKVLVVDDNVDAAMSLAMMLKLMGNETKTAHDGLEALDVAATYRPELILLDIGMPRLNGHETAKRIREQPWGKGVVLVALTGWGQEEDRIKSEQAGFNAHMVKPVELSALEKLLTNLRADTA
jgi:PAS domain S-box-containing protein